MRAVQFRANYFFDTEFIQHTKKDVDFVSLGVVCDDGRELYAESSEFDASRANFWIKNNILNLLGPVDKRVTNREIGDRFERFVGNDPNPRFFVKGGGDNDWNMLGKLYGGLKNLPKTFPKSFTDVDALWRRSGSAKRPPHPGNQHHALMDAKWAHAIWRAVTKPGLKEAA